MYMYLLQNDLKEFFSIANFVNPGVIGTLTEFNSMYVRGINKGNSREATPGEVGNAKNLFKQLNERTSKFLIQRSNKDTASGMNLPPRRDFLLFLPRSNYLDGENERICMSDKEPLVKILEVSDSNRRRDSCPLPPQTPFPSHAPVLQLRKAANEGNGVDASSCPKLDFVSRFVKSMIPTGDKVVIVSTLVTTLDVIDAMLKAQGATSLRIDGTTPAGERQGKVNKFNRGAAHVMLLSNRAGGAGLNLVGGNRLIMYDADWNPSMVSHTHTYLWACSKLRRPLFAPPPLFPPPPPSFTRVCGVWRRTRRPWAASIARARKRSALYTGSRRAGLLTRLCCCGVS